MLKLLLTLFFISGSTSYMASDINEQCKEDFHDIRGISGVITSINQTKCNDNTVCLNTYEGWCASMLTLNLQNFNAIAPNAFQSTNFTTLRLISKSETCEQKIVNLRPESFSGLSSVGILELDCAQFTLTPNPFTNLSFVDTLILSRMEFTEVLEDFITDFPKFKQLVLKEVDIPVITPNFTSKMNPGLDGITLMSNNLRVVEPKSFQRFHNLTVLGIIDNYLTDLQADIFDGLHALNTIFLQNNNITVLRNNTFSELSQLHWVDLSRNRIREIEFGTFSDLPIHVLDLSYNELEDLPVGIFRNLPNLEHLALISNKISTVRSNMFQGLPKITNLNLRYNNIHHIEANALQGVQLDNLRLDHNKLNVLEPDTFNGLRVEYLVLSDNDITEIKEHAFRNLKGAWIEWYRSNITQIQRDIWGVDDSVTFVK